MRGGCKENRKKKRKRGGGADRVLVALDKAHLLAIESLQIRVALPLAKILRQAYHSSHDVAAPCDIHIVASIHSDTVKERRPLVVAPQSMRYLSLRPQT